MTPQRTTLNVSLTPELSEFIASLVRSGKYKSASEVIREGLRLLKKQDALRELRLQELQREIAVGTEQADWGQFVDGEKAFEKLKAPSAVERRYYETLCPDRTSRSRSQRGVGVYCQK